MFQCSQENSHLSEPSNPLRLGHILEQDQAESLTGQTISPEIFNMIPSGNLIFVVVEEQPDTYGSIKLPDAAFKEPPGCGYIIGVGPFAGSEELALRTSVGAIGIVAPNPTDLLGVHCLFGAHTGVPIRTNMLERRFTGQVLIMSSRDIQVVDLNSESLVKRVQKGIEEKSLLVSS